MKDNVHVETEFKHLKSIMRRTQVEIEMTKMQKKKYDSPCYCSCYHFTHNYTRLVISVFITSMGLCPAVQLSQEGL